MNKETLRITQKLIRRAGQGRTPKTYCTYVAENEKHRHKLKVLEGTKLYDILENTIVSKTDRYANKVFIDGMYHNDELFCVTNPRIL